MKNTPKKGNSFFVLNFPVFFLLIFTCLISFSCKKEKPGKAAKLSFDELISEQPIELSITTDFNSLFADKETEKFQKAKCILKKDGLVFQERKIEVKTRGITRKKICDIPPIMLKFGKGKKKLKLKMVAPCHSDFKAQQLVYKEYLTYQLYNTLTDFSFKTQLAKITYQDSEGKESPITLTGFLIETDDELARRSTAKVLSQHEKLKYIDQDCYRMFTMFQYCIGNTDWNLNKRHNIKLICKKDSTTPIPVPYDFDYAGLVNAPYAIPHPQLPIKNVRERHFMWRGKSKDGFEKVIKIFEDKKEKLYSLVNQFALLDDDEKKEMLEFLDSFYSKISDEQFAVTS